MNLDTIQHIFLTVMLASCAVVCLCIALVAVIFLISAIIDAFKHGGSI